MTVTEAICDTVGTFLIGILRDETDPGRQYRALQLTANVTAELLQALSDDERYDGASYDGKDRISQIMSAHDLRLAAADWQALTMHSERMDVLCAAVSAGKVQAVLAEATAIRDARARAFAEACGDDS